MALNAQQISEIQEEITKLDRQIANLEQVELQAPPGGDDYPDLWFAQQQLNARANLIPLRSARAAYQLALDCGMVGICQCCGETIDPERMEAIPCATRCFNCQVKTEAKK